MKLVLDSSVALKWFLNEADSPQAVQLRNDFQRGVHELLAPDVFPIEAAHALTRSERKNVIPAGYARLFLTELLLDQPTLHDSRAILLRATDLSTQARHGVYDCLYVVLADDEDCKVVTSDQKLLAAFPGSTVDLATF
jgi:predicted nucleic acid-binding protein